LTPPVYAGAGGRTCCDMSAVLIVAATLAALLFVYLVVALFKPEAFE
jgi:K+-transporting ATPase KdpF subunit